MNIAIILCSGQGKRMGASKNKVLLNLQRKPIVFYAINNFEKSKDIDSIIVVCREEEQKYFHSIISRHKIKKVIAVISGGKERQDSGFNAVEFLDKKLTRDNKKNSILLFHNGANPFVSQEEIKASIQATKKVGASVVAHPTKDTIKRVGENNIIEETLDRSCLWNMQTPQTIKFILAKKAFLSAKKDNFYGTDDVSLVERIGGKVQVVLASQYNFKITTPIDLELAKVILKSKKNV